MELGGGVHHAEDWVHEERESMSGIVQLLTSNKPEAVRTVQRLHRNLGHPDPQQLTELLASRGASDTVLEVARQYHCVACQRYKKPNRASPAQPPTADTFNQVIQSDVLWTAPTKSVTKGTSSKTKQAAITAESPGW